MRTDTTMTSSLAVHDSISFRIQYRTRFHPTVLSLSLSFTCTCTNLMFVHTFFRTVLSVAGFCITPPYDGTLNRRPNFSSIWEQIGRERRRGSERREEREKSHASEVRPKSGDVRVHPRRWWRGWRGVISRAEDWPTRSESEEDR